MFGFKGRRALQALVGRYPRIAYIHVPKCAGSSVRDSLYRAVYPALLKATPAYQTINVRAAATAAELVNIDPMMCRQVALIDALGDPMCRFVTGHVLALPEVVRHFVDWKFVTVLRDPVSRFISQYVFDRYKQSSWAKVDCGIEEYLASSRATEGGSTLTRYFAGLSAAQIQNDPEAAIVAAIENLERFFSVGFVEDLHAWSQGLGKTIGRAPRLARLNASPKEEAVAPILQSPELLGRIQQLCAVDRDLYSVLRDRLGPTKVSRRS